MSRYILWRFQTHCWYDAYWHKRKNKGTQKKFGRQDLLLFSRRKWISLAIGQKIDKKQPHLWSSHKVRKTTRSSLSNTNTINVVILSRMVWKDLHLRNITNTPACRLRKRLSCQPNLAHVSQNPADPKSPILHQGSHCGWPTKFHVFSRFWKFFPGIFCLFSCVKCNLYCQYVSVCDMWPGMTPPLLGNLLGGPDLTPKKISNLLGFLDPSPMSVYARFRARTRNALWLAKRLRWGLGNSISIICVLAAEEATSHFGLLRDTPPWAFMPGSGLECVAAWETV